MSAFEYAGWRAFRGRAALGALFAGLTISACDLPTDLPIVENQWIVPAEETRFGVDELLPGDVSISPDSTVFLVAFDSVAFSSTLGDLCTACALADGLTVPKPPFNGSVESSVDFPEEVYEVVVVSGQVALSVENLLGFDPLRPSADSTGTMTLRVTDSADGDVLAELVVDGVDTAFPSGTTLVRSLSLAPTDVNGGLLATVVLASPLGDPVTVDASAALNILADPSEVRVSEVAVDVSDRAVTFDPVGLDDIDQDLVDDIVEGAFVLSVVNPFGVSADFDITIDGPTITPILRSGTIPTEPESTIRIDFTGPELRSFLGQADVVLTGGAVVSPTAGIVTVTPGDELVLGADLEVTLRLNGEGS